MSFTFKPIELHIWDGTAELTPQEIKKRRYDDGVQYPVRALFRERPMVAHFLYTGTSLYTDPDKAFIEKADKAYVVWGFERGYEYFLFNYDDRGQLQFLPNVQLVDLQDVYECDKKLTSHKLIRINRYTYQLTPHQEVSLEMVEVLTKYLNALLYVHVFVVGGGQCRRYVRSYKVMEVIGQMFTIKRLHLLNDG